MSELSDYMEGAADAAFPFVMSDGRSVSAIKGLSKRELFAAMAMQGLLSAVYSSKEMLNEFTQAKYSPGNDLLGRSYVSGCEAISRNAVSYADALLAELAKDRP